MINNYDDWWKLVNDNWQYLFRILDMYLPLNEHTTYDGQIIEESLAAHITILKEIGNNDLVRYFNRAWMNAPDNPSIHHIPAWEILCDLCSEEWALYPEGY